MHPQDHRSPPASPTAMTSSERCQLARDLMREAGSLARSLFLAREPLQVQTKGAHDWVSEADLRVEALLRERLHRAFPDDRILGEERGRSGGSEGAPLWIIDPIDGTTCFLNGIPQWCITLALVQDGQVLLGIVHDPMADELCWAIRGAGAWCNDQRLAVAPAVQLDAGLVAVSMSLQEGARRPAALLEHLARRGGMFTRIGACGLALSWVAQGRLLGMYEPRIHAWDSWAGELLVTEAGGRCLPPGQGARIDRPGPALAATPAIWPELRWILD